MFDTVTHRDGIKMDRLQRKMLFRRSCRRRRNAADGRQRTKIVDKPLFFVWETRESPDLCRPLQRILNYSHSIVAGGLPEMSYTTRLIPRTSLMMRFDT